MFIWLLSDLFNFSFVYLFCYYILDILNLEKRRIEIQKMLEIKKEFDKNTKVSNLYYKVERCLSVYSSVCLSDA